MDSACQDLRLLTFESPVRLSRAFRAFLHSDWAEVAILPLLYHRLYVDKMTDITHMNESSLAGGGHTLVRPTPPAKGSQI